MISNGASRHARGADLGEILPKQVTIWCDCVLRWANLPYHIVGEKQNTNACPVNNGAKKYVRL